MSNLENLMPFALNVAEAAALAAYEFIGRGQEKAADKAAVDAMRKAFDQMPMQGRIVIGEGERDEAPMLFVGEEVGTRQGPAIDIAVDPLEGTSLTAQARPNALAVMALAPKGHLLHAPDVYMEKIAVGPGLPENLLNIKASPKVNVEAVAKAKSKPVSALNVCVLDRPRHQAMIDEVRGAGARVILISDGDVAAIIQTALPKGGIDLYMGSGGAPEGVLAAAALRTLGGQMQGQLLFRNEDEKNRAKKVGISDFERIYSGSELASGDVLFIATGVTDGALVRGVHKESGFYEIESLVLMSEHHRIERIKRRYLH